MSINITCDECSRTHRVRDNAAGKRIKCKGCGKSLAVPKPTDDERMLVEATGQNLRVLVMTRNTVRGVMNLILSVGTVCLTVFLTMKLFGGFAAQRPPHAFTLLSLYVAFLILLMLSASQAAMYFLGRVEIEITGWQGTIFTGVGTLGRTQQFDWTKTTSIGKDVMVTKGGVLYYGIVLRGEKTIRTGKFLTKDQANLIEQALREWQQSQSQRDGS